MGQKGAPQSPKPNGKLLLSVSHSCLVYHAMCETETFKTKLETLGHVLHPWVFEHCQMSKKDQVQVEFLGLAVFWTIKFITGGRCDRPTQEVSQTFELLRWADLDWGISSVLRFKEPAKGIGRSNRFANTSQNVD